MIDARHGIIGEAAQQAEVLPPMAIGDHLLDAAVVVVVPIRKCNRRRLDSGVCFVM
jgi:hypothetical protein